MYTRPLPNASLFSFLSLSRVFEPVSRAQRSCCTFVLITFLLSLFLFFPREPGASWLYLQPLWVLATTKSCIFSSTSSSLNMRSVSVQRPTSQEDKKVSVALLRTLCNPGFLLYKFRRFARHWSDKHTFDRCNKKWLG